MQRIATNSRLHFNPNLPTFDRFIWPVVRTLKSTSGSASFDTVAKQIISAGRGVLDISDDDLRILRLRINRAIDVLTGAGIVFRTPRSTLTLSWWGKVHSRSDIEDVIWRVAGIELEDAREPFGRSVFDNTYGGGYQRLESPEANWRVDSRTSLDDRSQAIEDIVGLGVVESRIRQSLPQLFNSAEQVSRKLEKRMGTVLYGIYSSLRNFFQRINPRLQKECCKRTTARLYDKHKVGVGGLLISFLLGLTFGRWKPHRKIRSREKK
ncbi:MAG: hypothetical protein K2Z81_23140 [Cyanobacteria bacterium]|nr:hypothetical protein [Cyanobacteriota bacterium]